MRIIRMFLDFFFSSYIQGYLKYLVSIIQGRGNKSSGDNFHAAPNIDHSQEFVRNDLKEWLCWLRSVAFTLLRSKDWADYLLSLFNSGNNCLMYEEYELPKLNLLTTTFTWLCVHIIKSSFVPYLS